MKNVRKESNIVYIILVQDFCPLKIVMKIIQFRDGFRLNSCHSLLVSLSLEVRLEESLIQDVI